MESFDEIVIGQGLAGTTLAWCLLERGRRVLVIDREEKVTSSQVAAGLMTPVTGQRLTVPWRCREFFESAVPFYRMVERATGTALLHTEGALRFWQSEHEEQLFARRLRDDPSFAQLVDGLSNVPDAVTAGCAGFRMPQAARLNVPLLLTGSREEFVRRGAYRAADIDVADDVTVDATGVCIPRLKIAAKTLVFCQGFAAVSNPWFQNVEFDATRGEVLTLSIPDLRTEQTLHRGVWLAPQGRDRFRLGATSRWDQLYEGPTQAARDWLCSRLKEWLRCDFEIVGHQVGIRPVVKGRRPMIGRHPKWRALAYFNGLGARGALQAPLIAAQLADHLVLGTEVDPRVDLQHRVDCR